MPVSFLWVPLGLAGLNWWAVARNIRRLEYWTKPGAMLALLGWMWWARPAGQGLGPWGWFAAGIALSMLGDIFLMLPKERFIAGLAAFLLAHLAYVAGLNLAPVPLTWVTAVVVFLVGVTGGRLFLRIAAGLQAAGKQKLIRPVLVYSGVISVMLISALLTLLRADWQPGPALLVSGGAFLFYLSDSLLAWNRFVLPLRHGQLKVRITYHLGQIGLVVGAGLHFFP